MSDNYVLGDGWGFGSHGMPYHFYQDGKSLCGLPDPNARVFVTPKTDPPPYFCKHCIKRRKKQGFDD